MPSESIYLFLFCLIGISGFNYSQTITIKDKQSGKPIDLVTLSSEDPKVFTITNTGGQATISAFKGAKKIEILERLTTKRSLLQNFAWEILSKNGRALDAVEAGVKIPEPSLGQSLKSHLVCSDLKLFLQ